MYYLCDTEGIIFHFEELALEHKKETGHLINIIQITIIGVI